MKKSTIKKIIIYGLSTFLFLFAVLCFHIYMAYRVTAPTANSRTMARIDVKQPLSEQDANAIKVWLAHENGVDHYLVNTATNIIIFTYKPIKTTGNKIVNDFKANFNFRADRFVPSATDLKSSCPVAGSSYTYKVFKIISSIINPNTKTT